MNTGAGDSRGHLLAELGVTRYRLRNPAPGPEPVAMSGVSTAGDAPIATVTVPATETSVATGAHQPAPVHLPDNHGILLKVSAADSAAAPASGDAARIWAHVLAWMGLEDHQVHWQPVRPGATPDADTVALPAAALWPEAEGKRGLWLALKAPVRHLRASSRR